MPLPRRRSLLQIAARAPVLGPANGRAAAPSTAAPLLVASFPDLDRATQAVQPAWAAAGRPVQLVSRAYIDHHQAMNAALATGHGQPDVMALDLRFIGKFAAGGSFEDLAAPPYADAGLLAQLPAFALAQARTARGALMAMPTDIGPGTLLYRHDLLAKAGLAQAELTQSWDAYLQAGARIRQRTGAALLTDAGELRDILLRSNLQPGEGLYFDTQGRVLVDSERFRRAFEAGLAARRLGLDLKAASWSNEWVAAYRQGRVATQMMGCWLAGHLKNWLAPATAGKWRSAPLPEGAAAAWGGSFYAIPAQSRHKALAWELLKLLALDRTQQLGAFRSLDAFPALLAAQDDAFLAEPIAFLGGQPARLQWREMARRVPAVALDRYDAVADEVVRAELDKVLNHGKDIALALSDARRTIERRVRRRA